MRLAAVNKITALDAAMTLLLHIDHSRGASEFYRSALV